MKISSDDAEKVKQVLRRLRVARFAVGAKVRFNPELLRFGRISEYHLKLKMKVTAAKCVDKEKNKYNYALNLLCDDDWYGEHWLVLDEA